SSSVCGSSRLSSLRSSYLVCVVHAASTERYALSLHDALPIFAGLKAAGVRGVAVSIDSLRPSYHDNFRHGRGSLDDTIAALGRRSEEHTSELVTPISRMPSSA